MCSSYLQTASEQYSGRDCQILPVRGEARRRADAGAEVVREAGGFAQGEGQGQGGAHGPRHTRRVIAKLANFATQKTLLSQIFLFPCVLVNVLKSVAVSLLCSRRSLCAHEPASAKASYYRNYRVGLRGGGGVGIGVSGMVFVGLVLGCIEAKFCK